MDCDGDDDDVPGIGNEDTEFSHLCYLSNSKVKINSDRMGIELGLVAIFRFGNCCRTLKVETTKLNNRAFVWLTIASLSIFPGPPKSRLEVRSMLLA